MSKEIGPWLGVPQSLQSVCAVEGCLGKGRPQVCFYDGRLHHHGCIHYPEQVDNLSFRKGWGLLCDTHYRIIHNDHLKKAKAGEVK